MFSKVWSAFSSKKGKGQNDAGYKKSKGWNANPSVHDELVCGVPSKGWRPGRRRSCSDFVPQTDAWKAPQVSPQQWPKHEAGAGVEAEQHRVPKRLSADMKLRLPGGMLRAMSNTSGTASAAEPHGMDVASDLTERGAEAKSWFRFTRRRSSELQRPKHVESSCFAPHGTVDRLQLEGGGGRRGSGFMGLAWRKSLDYRRRSQDGDGHGPAEESNDIRRSGRRTSSAAALGVHEGTVQRSTLIELASQKGSRDVFAPSSNSIKADPLAERSEVVAQASGPSFRVLLEEAMEESEDEEEATDGSGNLRRRMEAALSPSSLPSSRSSRQAQSGELAASGADTSKGGGATLAGSTQAQPKGPWESHLMPTSNTAKSKVDTAADRSGAVPPPQKQIGPLATGGRAAGQSLLPVAAGPDGALSPGRASPASSPRPGDLLGRPARASQKKFPDFGLPANPPARTFPNPAVATGRDNGSSAGRGRTAGRDQEPLSPQSTSGAHCLTPSITVLGRPELSLPAKLDRSSQGSSPRHVAGSRRGSTEVTSPGSSRSSASWRRSLDNYAWNPFLSRQSTELSAQRRSLDGVVLKGGAAHLFPASPDSPLEAYSMQRSSSKWPRLRSDRVARSPAGSRRSSLDFSFVPRAASEVLRRHEGRAATPRPLDLSALDRLVPQGMEAGSGDGTPMSARRSLDASPRDAMLISPPIVVASSKVSPHLVTNQRRHPDGSRGAEDTPGAITGRSPLVGARRSVDYGVLSQMAQTQMSIAHLRTGRLSADHARELAHRGAAPLSDPATAQALLTPEDLREGGQPWQQKRPMIHLDGEMSSLRRDASTPLSSLTSPASARWPQSPRNPWPAVAEPGVLEAEGVGAARRAAAADLDVDACVFLTEEIGELRDEVWRLRKNRLGEADPLHAPSADVAGSSGEQAEEQLEGEVTWLRAEVTAMRHVLTQLEVRGFLHERAAVAADAAGRPATTPRRLMSLRKGDASPSGGRRSALLCAVLQELRGERACVDKLLALHLEGNSELQVGLAQERTRR